jgi:hypothetical protein
MLFNVQDWADESLIAAELPAYARYCSTPEMFSIVSVTEAVM